MSRGFGCECLMKDVEPRPEGISGQPPWLQGEKRTLVRLRDTAPASIASLYFLFPDCSMIASGRFTVCGDMTIRESLVPTMETIQYSQQPLWALFFEGSLLPALRFKVTQTDNTNVALLSHFPDMRGVVVTSSKPSVTSAQACSRRTSSRPRQHRLHGGSLFLQQFRSAPSSRCKQVRG